MLMYRQINKTHQRNAHFNLFKLSKLFKLSNHYQLNRHYYSNKHQQRGMGLVIVVIVLIAVIGLALSVLSADINENISLVEQSRTDAQNHSLNIAEEMYRLNPRATDVDADAPFTMADLCAIVSQSFLSSKTCSASPASPALQVGRDGIVQYTSLVLTEPGQAVPFGVVDGEAVQLEARAELQRHLRRIASVLENYHYQKSLLHLGGNASSDVVDLGVGKDKPLDNFLSCAYTRTALDPNTVLPCASSFTDIPTGTGLFTDADLMTIFETPVKYQTDGDVMGLISAYDSDSLLDVDLNDAESEIAGIVAAATPWPRGGGLAGNHVEWVFVRKIQVNE